MSKDLVVIDKDGVSFKATDYGDYFSVYIAGAWCCIPKNHALDPVGYLKSHLFWSDKGGHDGN